MKEVAPSRQLTVHWQPTILKFHKIRSLPKSQNCLLGSDQQYTRQQVCTANHCLLVRRRQKFVCLWLTVVCRPFDLYGWSDRSHLWSHVDWLIDSVWSREKFDCARRLIDSWVHFSEVGDWIAGLKSIDILADFSALQIGLQFPFCESIGVRSSLFLDMRHSLKDLVIFPKNEVAPPLERTCRLLLSTITRERMF